MVDVLAGLLSGSQYGPSVKTFHQPLGPTGVGVFILAVDIEKFMPARQFRALIESYTSSIRGSKKARGTSRIFLPGEIESEKEERSLLEGVEVSESTVNSLNQILEKIKCPLRLGKE
jgi:LDH2 family malate/lactate/ureidoglycolate dehydrogenase